MCILTAVQQRNMGACTPSLSITLSYSQHGAKVPSLVLLCEAVGQEQKCTTTEWLAGCCAAPHDSVVEERIPCRLDPKAASSSMCMQVHELRFGELTVHLREGSLADGLGARVWAISRSLSRYATPKTLQRLLISPEVLKFCQILRRCCWMLCPPDGVIVHYAQQG